jgi:hypothetical protein
MAIPTTPASLNITQTTSFQQLTEFADSLGTDVSRLRGIKNDDGSTTLYAGAERANFADRITGRAKEQSGNAREAIRSVIGREFSPDSEISKSVFKAMEETDKGRSISAAPLKDILANANREKDILAKSNREQIFKDHPKLLTIMRPILATVGEAAAKEVLKSPTLMTRLEVLSDTGWSITTPGGDSASAGWCN